MSAKPDPIRAALGAFLNADTELAELVTGGIHYGKAPAGTDHPYVVFYRHSDVAVWSMRDFYRNQLWLVKGVCRGGDAAKAEAIDGRCEDLLNDASLEIEGAQLMYLRREGGLPPHTGGRDSGSEVDSGEVIFESGSLYRLQAEPT